MASPLYNLTSGHPGTCVSPSRALTASSSCLMTFCFSARVRKLSKSSVIWRKGKHQSNAMSTNPGLLSFRLRYLGTLGIFYARKGHIFFVFILWRITCGVQKRKNWTTLCMFGTNDGKNDKFPIGYNGNETAIYSLICMGSPWHFDTIRWARV